MSKLRILIAEDSQSLRTAYKNILETKDEIEVVGMASDGEEALEMTRELSPDVAVLDVRMPKMDGLAAANRIMTHDSRTAIVLVSAYDDLAFVSAIMKNDASRKAYILKNSLDDITELIRVVEAVAKGQAVLDGAIVQNLLAIYRRRTAAQSTPLTDTEEGVLQLMLEGYDESEISQTLGLPLEPVEALANSLCEKLGLGNQDGPNRSPQVVQALVNLCFP